MGGILPPASFLSFPRKGVCGEFFIKIFMGTMGPPSWSQRRCHDRRERKLSENSPGRWHGDSGGSDYSLEPGWCWHEFRCLSAPCAVFVVQLLDPGETFRWESVVLGEKRALILYSGPAGRAVGCDWYRWQSECRGDVAVLVQELPGNNEGKRNLLSCERCPWCS